MLASTCQDAIVVVQSHDYDYFSAATTAFLTDITLMPCRGW